MRDLIGRLGSGLFQDLRFSAQSIARNPGFATVAILTLALGIGANTAIFSVVEAVMLRGLPYPEAERLVGLAEKSGEDSEAVTLSYGTFAEWRDRSRSFENIAAFRLWLPALTGAGEPERLSGMRVTADFFPMLRTKAALGRLFLPAEDRPDNWRVVILSDGFWKRRFGGDPELIGTSIFLNERAYQVVGVLPADFQALFFTDGNPDFDVWAPLGYDVSLPWGCHSCRHLRGMGRMKTGVTAEQATAELTLLQRTLADEYPDAYARRDEALAKPLKAHLVGDADVVLATLLGAVGLILLIACANVANLLLARACHRRKEIALRRTLGAGRFRLARLLLTESLTLSMAGGGLGVLAAMWFLPLLVAGGPAEIPRLDEVGLNGSVLAFTFLVSVATGFLFGLAPMLQAASIDLHEALKEGSRESYSASRPRARRLLAVAEVALAFALLVAGGLLLKSFHNLLQVDPGLKPEGLLTLNTYLSGSRYEDDDAMAAFHRHVLERLIATPGVEGAAAVSVLPLSGDFDRAGFHIQDRKLAGAEAPSVDRYIVTPDYFRVMGVALLRGRGFTGEDRPDAPPVALVSRTLAERQWPGGDPIGKRIQLGGRSEDGPWLEVVGVVGDVKQYGLDSPSTMQAYQLLWQRPAAAMSWVVRSDLASDTLERQVRQAVWAVDPNQPVFGVAPMATLVRVSLAQRRFTMMLLTVFGGLALLLATIGVYGLVSYSASLRARDMGIRIALGASRSEILKLVLREAGALAMAGIALGCVFAAVLASVISTLLFEARAADLAIPLASAATVAAASLLASYFPARRAASTDPTETLRSE